MLPAQSFSISIGQDWRALYERIWRPQYFPQWASGLARSHLRQEGDRWLADGAEGPVRIRFTPHNDFGVMDHHVEVAPGREVHVPLRVFQNGDGAEVVLTLFRQPEMDDARYAADAAWIERDLGGLKALIEG